jgi:hypothetical protein
MVQTTRSDLRALIVALEAALSNWPVDPDSFFRLFDV